MTNIHISAEQTIHLEPDRDAAERFLAALDPSAERFTFQTFDDNKERAKRYRKEHSRADPNLTSIIHGSLTFCWNALVRFNKRGAGIYVTVNETDLKGREVKNIKPSAPYSWTWTVRHCRKAST
jgi:hypothetical protein